MFAVVIFLGAFLLFHVQPMIAKFMLPWFGSTPAVWTTCMLFFQALLLGGYAYADQVTRHGAPRRQASIHTIVVLAAIGLMVLQWRLWGTPLLPGDNWKVFSAARPQGHLLLLLLCSVGLPYFVLATTNPLLQKWFTLARPNRSPYPLYALSNLGSLLGLLGYPLAVERWLSIPAQAWMVAAAFVTYGALCLTCAWRQEGGGGAERVAGGAPSVQAGILHEAPPTFGTRVLWVLLAMCGSALLLAVTNQLCAEVAVVPLLWVVPLALYLITFMLSFSTGPWAYRPLWLGGLSVTTLLAVLTLLNAFRFNLPGQVAILGGLLFSGCMFCHGELSRLRPATRHLTGYYLWISAGGALGGLFVGLLAPACFRGFWEFHGSLMLCWLLVLGALLRDSQSALHRGSRLATVALLAGASPLVAWVFAPFVLPGRRDAWGVLSPGLYYGAAGVAGLLLLWMLVRRPAGSRWHWQRPGWARAALAVAFFAIELTLAHHVATFGEDTEFYDRNFYGLLRVRELDSGGGAHLPVRVLVHGRVIHGVQFKDLALARRPTSYFSEDSGVGLLLRNHPQRSRGDGRLRVGVVGLGAGTLAAYVGTNDWLRFYEINPMVLALSEGPQPYFTFLRDAPGHIESRLGDARLELEHDLATEGPAKFDVLVLDAFSSDAIPVHLLTREAFALYLKQIREPDGVIAMHASNRVLDLLPVARANARQFGLAMAVITKSVADEPASMRSDWVLFARHPDVFQHEPFASRADQQAVAGREVAWTDSYSSLLDLLIR
ncbi:MAG: hypothetical protein K8T26_17190 [Lentisphaerae bacterium]|nr:hypothetical protein [Lentisphaerota bacterium]